MKQLFMGFMLLLAACNITEQPVEELEARFAVYDFPATDIWGDSLANAGNVSDLGPGYIGPNVQRRQLPSRKLGEVLQTSLTRFHVARVDKVIYKRNKPVAYWMEGVTVLHVKKPALGVDTVVNLAECRFYAGLDSYKSIEGYVYWYRGGIFDKQMPSDTVFVNGENIGVYAEGDTLSVRADMNSNMVVKWWIETP